MVFMRWGNGACAYNFKYTLLKRRSVSTHTIKVKSDLSRPDGMSRASRDALIEDAQRIEKSVRKFMARESQSQKRDWLPELEPANLILEVSPPRNIKNRAKERSMLRKILPTIGRSDPRETATVDSFKTYGWIILLAIVMFLLPLLIPTILLVTFWLALIGYLSIGPQRFAKFVCDKWSALSRFSKMKMHLAKREQKAWLAESNEPAVQRGPDLQDFENVSVNSGRTYRNHAKVPPFDRFSSTKQG